MKIWVLWTYIANFSNKPELFTIKEDQKFGDVIYTRYKYYDVRWWNESTVHIFGETGHIYSGSPKIFLPPNKKDQFMTGT